MGIAIDMVKRHVYWTQKGPKNGGQGAIYRAGLDIPPGTDADSRDDIETLVTGLPEPIDLALDPGNATLYWTDRGDEPDGNTLNRARIGPDGLSGREVVARGSAEGIGLAPDHSGQKAFVTDLGGTVYVCNLQPGSRFTPIAAWPDDRDRLRSRCTPNSSEAADTHQPMSQGAEYDLSDRDVRQSRARAHPQGSVVRSPPLFAAHASKLIACGSKKKDDGSDLGGGIYIIDVDHRSDAEAFIAQDPYKLADLFERVEIIRWNKAYVDGRCYMSTGEIRWPSA